MSTSVSRMMLRAGIAIAVGSIAPMVGLVVAGCPDSGFDPNRFKDGGSSDGDLSCPDIPNLLKTKCSGAGCHSPMNSAASLDLVSMGVTDRITGQPAKSCLGTLADPTAPEASVIYKKIAPDPSCGGRMPLGGTPLSSADIACVRDWIAGLTPPVECDASTMDCGCPKCLCAPGETQPCYSGPMGTSNVGACKAGTQTCNPDGLTWGDCQGETLPKSENCLTKEDEDCDGKTPACSELWSKGYANDGAQSIRAVAVDADGNVIAVGDFEGTLDFGGGPLVATLMKRDIVVLKLDKYGNFLWAKRFGDSSNQFGQGVAVDSAGNIAVTGRAFGNIDFGGGSIKSKGTDDIAVAKLDKDGNFVWAKLFGGIDPDRPEHVAFDPQGNVLVTGAYTGNAVFGGLNFSAAGLRDIFMLKLSAASGAVLFGKTAGSVGDDIGGSITADALGNVVVTGRFSNTANFGGQDLTSVDSDDIFVVKYDPTGAHLWSKRFGGLGPDMAYDVKVDQASGEIVLTGSFTTSLDIGPQPVLSAGMRDLFVAKLDSAGNAIFSKGFGDSADQLASPFDTNTRNAVSVGPGGNLYLTGPLVGAADFGGGLIASAGNSDVYLVKLDPMGGHLSSKLFGGTSLELGLDIGVSSNGHAALVGRYFGKSIDFGQGPIMGSMNGDAFVAQLLP